MTPEQRAEIREAWYDYQDEDEDHGIRIVSDTYKGEWYMIDVRRGIVLCEISHGVNTHGYGALVFNGEYIEVNEMAMAITDEMIAWQESR